LRQCQGSRSLSREQPAPALPLRFVRKLSSSTQLSRMLDGISKAESSNLAARIHTRESNAATRPRSAADVVAVEFPARPSFSPNGSSFVQYPAKWNIPFPRERPRCLRRHAAPPHSPFPRRPRGITAIVSRTRSCITFVGDYRRALEGSRTIRRYIDTSQPSSWPVVDGRSSCFPESLPERARHIRANSNGITSGVPAFRVECASFSGTPLWNSWDFPRKNFVTLQWGKDRARSALMRDDTLHVIERNACR